MTTRNSRQDGREPGKSRPMEGGEKRVVVVGAGFAGLSAAANLAFQGFNVTVLEKHSQPGGRNRLFCSETEEYLPRLDENQRIIPYELKKREKRDEKLKFLFEIGPSWLWMPEVHEEFYRRVGKKMEDYVELSLLEPAYKMFFETGEVEVPNGKQKYEEMLMNMVQRAELPKKEKLAIKQMVKREFNEMYREDQQRYQIAMDHFIQNPSLSPLEFLTSLSLDSFKALVSNFFTIGIFASQHTRIERNITLEKKVGLFGKATGFVGSLYTDAMHLVYLVGLMMNPFNWRESLSLVEDALYLQIGNPFGSTKTPKSGSPRSVEMDVKQAKETILRKVKMLFEWPVIFVGGSPELIPELYSIVGYSAIEHGTLVPKNGMYDLIRGMYDVCLELGVDFQFNSEVSGIAVDPEDKQCISKVYYKLGSKYSSKSEIVQDSHEYDHLFKLDESKANVRMRKKNGSTGSKGLGHCEGKEYEKEEDEKTNVIEPTSSNRQEKQYLSGDFIDYCEADDVVVTSDMAFFEQSILPRSYRMYNESFWNKALLSPTCLLFFVGLNCRLKDIAKNKVSHHLLFFDGPLYEHMDLIYPDEPDNMTKDPAALEKYQQMLLKRLKELKNPLFYVNVASSSHSGYVSGSGESLFFLVPMPHASLNSEIESWLFENLMVRLQERLHVKPGVDLLQKVAFKKAFQYDDFVKQYGSLRGNAFGISNSLLQTAFLRPRMRSLKLNNLYYAGQSTAPGGGIPPCIISGTMASDLVKAAQEEREAQRGVFASLFNNILDLLNYISATITLWIMIYINPKVKF